MAEKGPKKTGTKKKAAAAAPASPFDSLADASPAIAGSGKKQSVKEGAASVKKGPAAKAKAAPARKASAKRPAVNATPTAPAPISSPASPFADVSPTSPAAGMAASAAQPLETAAAVAKPAAAAPETKPELSPSAKLLAEPVLPQLERDNRARLMMQTPTELYFYWAVRENPYQLLKKAFGSDTGSYSLVLKLSNLNTGEEEIYPAEAEGNWWFHVEPNGLYEAEIGFYAPNRPYFRIIYSNTVATPRRGPSPKPATESVWTVSAAKFAEVLDVAGFASDAVDVAMAGDDHEMAEAATHTAFSTVTNGNGRSTEGIAGEDIRYALRALASGMQIEQLRTNVGSKLFGVLKQQSADLSAEKAADALAAYFEVPQSEYMEETAGAAVFGASVVSFPRGRRPRRPDRSLTAVSSHSTL